MKSKSPLTSDQKLDYLIEQVNKISHIEENLQSVKERVEEIRVESDLIKHQSFKTDLRLSTIEHNTEIMRIDLEDMKREIKGHTTMLQDILEKATSITEHKALETRVAVLEQS